jgi:hypothetical protein
MHALVTQITLALRTTGEASPPMRSWRLPCSGSSGCSADASRESTPRRTSPAYSPWLSQGDIPATCLFGLLCVGCGFIYGDRREEGILLSLGMRGFIGRDLFFRKGMFAGAEEKLAGVTVWLRRKRRILYVWGFVFLASGLLVDLAGAVLNIWYMEAAGILLPVVGSVLLLLNYVTAKGRTVVKKYPEAEDEAVFGSGFYLYLGLCILTMLLFVPQVLEEIASRHYSVAIFVPFPVEVIKLTGISLMLYFMFIVVALLLSYNAFTKNGFLVYLKLFRGEEVPKECSDGNPYFGNVVSTTLWIFLAYLFFSVAYSILMVALGIHRVIPDFGTEIWRQVFNFANASVWEEITDRVLFLGVPLLCIDYLFRRKSARSASRYLLGGNTKIGVVESGVVLFSASLFALSHLEIWDIYKIPPTVLGGLFLAYLFLKFGLYASIMMHFTIDFFDVPLQALDAESVGFPIVFILIGFLAFVSYARAFVRFVRHDLMGMPVAEPAVDTMRPVRANSYEYPALKEYAGKRTPEQNRDLALISASLCIFVSAAIMLWASYDIATDPTYGGLTSSEDWLGWLAITIPNLSAILVLIIAWTRKELRIFLLAGTLSGFSFVGPLSVLAELVLWRAHKKFGLPWKRSP